MAKLSPSEYLKSIKTGAKKAGSQYNIRNEKKQERKKVQRYSTLKKATNKGARLLFPTQYAFPFNATTGEVGEFNENMKWRLTISSSSTLDVIKVACLENEELKEFYMDRAGVSEWNIEMGKTTDEDLTIFRRYRVFMTFTANVINVNLPGISNSKYGLTVLAPFERDPETDEIIESEGSELAKDILAVNKLYRDIAYEKGHILDQKVKEGKVDLNKDDIDNMKRRYRDAIRVSADRPENYTMCAEIPETRDLKIDYDKVTGNVLAEDMDKFFVFAKQTASLKQSLTDYLDGKYASADKYVDFCELEMKCPNKTEPIDIGKGTTFSIPTMKLKEIKEDEGKVGEKFFDDVVQGMQVALDKDLELEKIFLATVRMKRLNEDLLGTILDAVSEDIDFENEEGLSDKVILQNKDIIVKVLGDRGAEMVAEVEFKGNGNLTGAVTEEASAAELKRMRLEDAIKSEQDETDTDDDGEMIIE